MHDEHFLDNVLFFYFLTKRTKQTLLQAMASHCIIIYCVLLLAVPASVAGGRGASILLSSTHKYQDIVVVGISFYVW
jgi:hypothetical protein